MRWTEDITSRSVERFFERFTVNNETGCWLWTRGKDCYGYGAFSVNSRMVKAHRAKKYGVSGTEVHRIVNDLTYYPMEAKKI